MFLFYVINLIAIKKQEQMNECARLYLWMFCAPHCTNFSFPFVRMFAPFLARPISQSFIFYVFFIQLLPLRSLAPLRSPSALACIFYFYAIYVRFVCFFFSQETREQISSISVCFAAFSLARLPRLRARSIRSASLSHL